MIFAAFLKSLSQLSDSRFRKVLWMGIGLTVALLFGAYAGLLWVIEWLTGESMTLPLVGEVTWVGDLLGVGSLIFMIVLSVFLMIPVASAITSLFLDEVAQAVEDRHYPGLPPATPVPFADAARDTISFLGLLIGANLLAFVLYVFFPPATPFIFWGMNGFLLGREYFTLAAMRRIGREGARTMRRKHASTIWIAGILMAMPLSVPIVNLLVPILGAATFTHIYHVLSRR
ncbi:EI24 domain-containing protein [Marinovum sp.]|uniref:EI24 domain-containing protein n=1 Tax=Marinovum sp. TaxID=2024839 RepID=UPI002B264DE0|nr:EI24 domain-containing protein [Marinovum sp.]